MTKMGIKEFRERLSEVARGDEVVSVTHHGKVVGTFTPKRPYDPVKAEEAGKAIKQWHEELRSRGIEPDDLMAQLGMDPWGEPLVGRDDR